jgi:hypothetical protein
VGIGCLVECCLGIGGLVECCLGIGRLVERCLGFSRMVERCLVFELGRGRGVGIVLLCGQRRRRAELGR